MPGGIRRKAKAALSELCATYYAPVFAFMRRSVPDEDSARDFTQEFFARLLARGGINNVAPQRGRFRSFLLGVIKHFLADMGAITIGVSSAAEAKQTSLSTRTRRLHPVWRRLIVRCLAHGEFDRKWALTLLGRALAAMAQEYEEAGKSEQFEALKPWLTGDGGGFKRPVSLR